MRDTERTPWLLRPEVAGRLFWALSAICLLLAAADLLLDRHAHFAWESWPLFYCAVGFGAFWCIVIAGKHLRRLLWRPEDYYDR